MKISLVKIAHCIKFNNIIKPWLNTFTALFFISLVLSCNDDDVDKGLTKSNLIGKWSWVGTKDIDYKGDGTIEKVSYRKNLTPYTLELLDNDTLIFHGVEKYKWSLLENDSLILLPYLKSRVKEYATDSFKMSSQYGYDGSTRKLIFERREQFIRVKN